MPSRQAQPADITHLNFGSDTKNNVLAEMLIRAIDLSADFDVDNPPAHHLPALNTRIGSEFVRRGDLTQGEAASAFFKIEIA